MPGYESTYEVSNNGEFRYRRGKTLYENRSVHPKGYLYIYLNDWNGKRGQYRVHTLVLEAFVGPCPKGMEACHNNGDKKDNRVKNLRWDTASNNMRDLVKHGNHNMARMKVCKNGHKLEGDNVSLYIKDGKVIRRICRVCNRDRNREFQRVKRAKARKHGEVNRRNA